MPFLKKKSPRRNKVRQNIADERLSRIRNLVNANIISSLFLWLVFAILCSYVLSFDSLHHARYRETVPTVAMTVLIALAGGFYIYRYQKRIIENHLRALALGGLFLLLLATSKIAVLLSNQTSWATATAVAASIILAVAYEQRFAMGISVFYCLFAALSAGVQMDIRLLLIMLAAVFTCCLSLKEIRTRMKLLEVSVLVAAIVFLIAFVLGFLTESQQGLANALSNAGFHAAAAFIVGLLIQSLLPLIEKMFRISTSMTLLDYSDANQSLLKRLAIEAPGTFSHSLLVGSIAEAAAESIGRNGLLCRVGAYYHDIGKINKPGYFVENEIGSTSRHKELSPAMSQLIIVGHVKDGIEMAKEYGLPVVLYQFIETHHGTTLVEYFYNEAKKKHDEKSQRLTGPSENEFRYVGPKPRIKEAAIVMLADAVEGAVRSLNEVTPTKIETIVHNMAMKRLQDGQFDECDMSLRELSQIEKSMSKTLAAHYHGRIAYPNRIDVPEEVQGQPNVEQKDQ